MAIVVLAGIEGRRPNVSARARVVSGPLQSPESSVPGQVGHYFIRARLSVVSLQERDKRMKRNKTNILLIWGI